VASLLAQWKAAWLLKGMKRERSHEQGQPGSMGEGADRRSDCVIRKAQVEDTAEASFL
jgi:hypothetical protein